MDSSLLAFCAVAALVTVTPGADTLLVFRNSLRGGRRDGFRTAFGVCAGLFVHAVLSAAGVSAVLASSAEAFHALKIAGAGYLLWLGVQTFRHAGRAGGMPGPGEGSGRGAPAKRIVVPAGRSVREGFLSNVLNPKVAVFYLAFLPQFIGPADPVLARSILLAAVHCALGIAWLAGVAALVASGRAWLDRPAVRTWTSRFAGAALIGLGLRLALEEK